MFAARHAAKQSAVLIRTYPETTKDTKDTKGGGLAFFSFVPLSFVVSFRIGA